MHQTFERMTDLRKDDKGLDCLIRAGDVKWLQIVDDSIITVRDDPTCWQDAPFIEATSDEIVQVFLGMLGENAVFARLISSDYFDVKSGELALSRVHLRPALMAVDDQTGAIFAYGRTLLHFHQTHQFCGRCGVRTQSQNAGHSRLCPGCSLEHFPRYDPAAIVLVTCGDRILLGRSPHFPEGLYSILAGFVEPGESLEEGARREVFEESGLMIQNVTYVSSQAWPFPRSLMIGMKAEVDVPELTLDETEIEDAHWLTREDIRRRKEWGMILPPPISIARKLIDDWRYPDGRPTT